MIYFGDPCNLEEKSASLSVQAVAIARNADVLAWESGADEVNLSIEYGMVERSNVIPDWGKIQVTRGHPFQKYGLSVWLALTVCECSHPRLERESDAANS